jgi:hypothetical protein
MKCTAFVDAHVHLHECYPAAKFFDAALVNLTAAGAGRAAPTCHFLLMTECAGERVFDALDARAKKPSAAAIDLGHWDVAQTQDDQALRLSSPAGTLYVVAGRQVACREGLELLLPGTRAQYEDHRSIREVLGVAAGSGLPHVVPWGAGKWFLSRGRLLSDLVREFRNPLLFLGDEAGRPWFWRYPKHFAEAKAQGVRDLPGTDPLPFAHDYDKVGRMGAIVQVDLEPQRPWTSLLASLADPRTELKRFAKLEGMSRFVRNQVGMQLRKRSAA